MAVPAMRYKYTVEFPDSISIMENGVLIRKTESEEPCVTCGDPTPWFAARRRFYICSRACLVNRPQFFHILSGKLVAKDRV